MKISFVLIVLLLTGCANPIAKYRPEDLIIENWAAAPPADNVILTQQQIRHDLEIYRYAIEKVYIGWYFAEYWRKERFLVELDKIEGPMSRAQLIERMKKTTYYFKDNHFDVIKDATPSLSQPQSTEGAASKAANPVTPPLLIGPPENPALPHTEFYSTKSVQVGPRRMFYIDLKSFAATRDLGWNRLYQSMNREISEHQGVILDMRENHGGFVFNARRIAAQLNHGSNPEIFSKSYEMNTPESTVAWIYNKKRDGPLDKISREQIISEIRKAEEKRKKGDLPYGPFTFNSWVEPAPFTLPADIPFIILISPRCASACEILVALAYDNPQVIRVGQHTLGAFHYGNASTVQLPESHIRIGMPVNYDVLKDDYFIESAGLTPQVLVPEATDAVSYLQEHWDKIEPFFQNHLQHRYAPRKGW